MRNKWSKEFGNRALTSKVLSKQEVASDSESVSYETVSREYEERGGGRENIHISLLVLWESLRKDVHL